MSARDAAVDEACLLMEAFAERTGLGSERAPHRYLWTDAFAVCNDLALWRATRAAGHRERALQLIEQVHRVLGRHRPDDARRGWISGLGEREGALHPTRGGLRIGKPLPERPDGAPFDERLEWDRDGQYFHYLTRWMHALDQTARATRDARLNTWARELADAAHRAFVYGPPGRRQMVWKMSIDLSRPLVPSMGQHDPLDGWITCLQLQATADALSAPAEPRLDDASADFARMTEGRSLATADPLGLGGLLIDAGLVAQLMGQGSLADGLLLEALLDAAHAGLSHFARRGDLHQPAARRLAFRELGLVIGLAGVGGIARALEPAKLEEATRARLVAELDALAPYAALGSPIASFWRDPAARRAPSWSAHRDINDVMLAACLVPEGVLALRPAREVLAGALRGT